MKRKPSSKPEPVTPSTLAGTRPLEERARDRKPTAAATAPPVESSGVHRAAIVQVTATSAANSNDKLAMVLGQAGLSASSALAIRAQFEACYTQAIEWASKTSAIKVTDASQTGLMAFARESRLALRQIRLNVEHTREELKRDSLKRGQAIDSIARVIRELIEPIEADLQAQEDFVKNAELARRQKLRDERTAALHVYGVDPAIYADLAGFTDEAWTGLLEGHKTARDTRLARVKADAEAAEKAQIEREQEAVRLREEAAKARAETARIEAEQRAERQKAAVERAKLEAAQRAEREEAEARQREEREARLKVERELAATKAAEKARLDAEEEERRQAEQAPDREKIYAFMGEIIARLNAMDLKTEMGRAARTHMFAEVRRLLFWVETTLKTKGL